MRWHLGNITIRVENATHAEQSWVVGFLTYVHKTYDPRARQWTFPRVTTFNEATNEFPTGLGLATFQAAIAQGYAVEVVDERVRPCEPDPKADLEWLKHHPAVKGEITHQIDAVRAAASQKRGIIWVPTGGGKTEIAIGISKALPCRWMFLVHRADLLEQTARRYELRTGIPAGVVGDGKMDIPPSCRFIVCTFQTAYQAIARGNDDLLPLLRRAEGALVDECHSASADTFARVLREMRSAYYRYGMSGTPLARGDGENLSVIGGLGPVIYRALPQVLIDAGILAVPTIKMVEVCQKSLKGDWGAVYDESVVGSEKRNQVVATTVQRAAKPCLVFVERVEHGKTLLAMLTAAGVAVEFVWGANHTKGRKAAIERLERTDIDVLISNVIFQEGVDIPLLRSVVIAAGGKAAVAALQRIGRGMRAEASTGKRTFEVWDFFDRGCGCRPDREDGEHPGCRWLEKHSRARMKHYQGDGHEVGYEKEQMGLGL